MTRGTARRLLCATSSFAIGSLVGVSPVRAQCQNQIEIDVCKAGCTATSATCGALCGAAVDVCTGVCIGGCAVGCTIDCCAGFCPNSSDCRSCIGNCEDDCEAGCQLDCDDCIFDCERDCESICRPFRQIGEFCIPLIDRCADGLTCWPFPAPGDSQPRCFPSDNDELFPDDVCRSFYVPGIHQLAINDGSALSFGAGAASAVGISETIETGVVYGEDGRFGCYFTTCVGVTIDVEVGIYAGVGAFIGYDAFRGEAIMTIEEAGEIIVFAFAQFFSLDSGFLGVVDAISLEASLAPITAGVYDCFTIVDTVGMRRPDGSLAPVSNSPPLAVCHDRDACADGATCVATVDIDNGSVDPDGQSLSYAQTPAGPYGIGEHVVNLTVADPDQGGDQCSAVVTVNDCTPPEITCPAPTTVLCEGHGGTLVDPGDATVVDCTAVSIHDPGESMYPAGTTAVTYSATDAAGNEASCETTVTVLDEDPPILEAVTAVPPTLWPPNHQMQEVALAIAASDVCDPDLACEIVRVTSDEINHPGNGSPHATSDFEILGGTTVMLRAERLGNSDGRTYTIDFTCADDAGNSVSGSTTVAVAHDLRDVSSQREKRTPRRHGPR